MWRVLSVQVLHSQKDRALLPVWMGVEERQTLGVSLIISRFSDDSCGCLVLVRWWSDWPVVNRKMSHFANTVEGGEKLVKQSCIRIFCL